MLQEKDIKGLTPEQIKNKFSLPGDPPKFRTNVKVPNNTLIEQSVAGKNVYGNGSGTQFRLLEQIPEENFSNLRFLPEIGTFLPPPIEGVPPLEGPIFPFEEPIEPIELP